MRKKQTSSVRSRVCTLTAAIGVAAALVVTPAAGSWFAAPAASVGSSVISDSTIVAPSHDWPW